MDQTFQRSVEIANELARLKKEVRSVQRREQRDSKVPAAMWRVAIVIFVLTHPSIEPACLYLEQRWQHWHSQHQETQQRLHDWYAQLLATSGVAAVLQPTTTVGRGALQKAQTFVQEMQLHTWVDNANVQKGIAPQSSILVLRASTPSTSLGTQTLMRVSMKTKCKLQWLRRWRRRWRVGLGPVQARDTLPPAECRMKAFF